MDELALGRGEQRGGLRQVQHAEKLLVVYDLGVEIAQQQHRPGARGADHGLAFVQMAQHVAGDGAAVNNVDAPPGRAGQRLAVKAQVAHVADFGGQSRGPQTGGGIFQTR